MALDHFEFDLLNWAGLLRPKGRKSASVIEIASSLGTVVSLHVHTTAASPSAQLDFRHRPPKINLYRRGKADGEREVLASDENLLTARERFSVAHELGHWIALTHLRVEPRSDKRGYWQQERIINSFAGSLLAPDWLVEEWLEGVSHSEPISPFSLKSWADTQCRTSEEVVAKRIVQLRSYVGFLRVVPARRRRDGARVLKVLCSAAGQELMLPNERSYIHESQLYGLVEKNRVGSASVSDLHLVRCVPQDLRVSWRRGKPLGSEETTWISFALRRNESPSQDDTSMRLPLEPPSST
jgi:IrrE N-terminal-like domain